MTDEVDVIETDDDVNDQTEESAAEIEAREKGWKPQEEWDGDPKRWMPADDFLEMNTRRLEQADSIAKAEISRLNGQVSEMKATISDLGDYMKKADQRALEKARKELEGQMRTAVEDGDTEAFDRVKADIDALDKEVKDADEKPQAKEQDGESPAFRDWHAKNDWYMGDGAKAVLMTDFADKAAAHLRKKYDLTAMPEAKLYDEVEKLVKEEFSDQFENTRRRKPPAVEGASNGTGKGGDGSLWSQVDKEGRDAFSRFVKQGLFEDTKEGRESYADTYING